MYLKLALEVLPDPNSKPTLNDCVKERLSYCEYGGLTEAAKVTLRLTTIKPRIMWMILEVTPLFPYPLKVEKTSLKNSKIM